MTLDCPGVTINLVWFGVDSVEGTADDVVRSTVTDIDGDYLFGALPAGSFRVSVDSGSLPNAVNSATYDLDGIGSPHTVTTSLIDSLVGIVRNDVDFGYTANGTIGDHVWLDLDGNAVQTLGEMGLANVDVQLNWFGFDGIAGNADDVAYTLTTDSDGNYDFVNLASGDFAVDVVESTAPLGTTLTTGNDPLVIALTAGQDFNDGDFGFWGPGQIGDFVYFDANNNGTFDANDAPYPGLTVTWAADIDNDGLVESFSTQTNSAGNYLFSGLPLDAYTISLTTPSGTIPTDDASGPINNQSNVTLTSLVPVVDDHDFGITGTGVIGDLVFWDYNGNGVQETNEAGLPGILVYLHVDLDQDGSNETTLSTTTAANGTYGFANLAPGGYEIEVVPPAGSVATFDNDGLGTPNRSNVILSAGQIRTDQDFGYNGTGAIGDLVFFDRLGDGGAFNAADGDYGLGNVDVTISIDLDGDSVSDFTRTTTTAADGSYQFLNLIAGSYLVSVDSSDAPDLIGFNPTFDADGVSTANSSTRTIVSGETASDQDFAFHGTPDYNITIDDGEAAVDPGQALSYQVTVRNDGTLRGNNAEVTVTFPNDLLINVVADSAGIVDPIAGTVTWNASTTPELAVMMVGEQVILTIDAEVIGRVDGTHRSIDLTANVTDDLVNGIDPNLADNTDIDIDEIPEIAVVKRLIGSADGSIAGNRQLTYELIVENTGSIELTDLSLLENLGAQFGAAYQGVVSAPTITNSTADIDPNLAIWDGSSTIDLLDGASGLLRPGQRFSIQFAIEIDVDQLHFGSSNQVTAFGDFDVSGIESGTVSDLSDAGDQPLSNNPGFPGDTGGFDDPTLVPAIGLAKNHGDAIELTDSNGNPNGWFVVPTTLVIENLGATDLGNLQLIDDVASIYANAFIRTENLRIDASGVSGLAPTVNASWTSDTSSSLVSGGLLRPGDSFLVTFDVVVDPDRGGNSQPLDNQAVVTGSDPTNASTVVQDYSDSGLNPNSSNAGQPGDLGTADDPTPLQIADLGLSKQIISTVQKGLSYELTIELNLENTGTVDLRGIELRDDIAEQYGGNFSRVIGVPRIVASTATETPTVQASYSTDTTLPIFDGSDGLIRPGEFVVVKLVIEVVPLSGQTETIVVNQANASADPLDENGNALLDDSGDLVSRVSDLSDSGPAATGSNPGAPGDTGSWNDPTPQPLTFFTFDAFNDFSGERKSQTLADKRDPSNPFDTSMQAESYEHRRLTTEISSLAPEPIFSGAARPGTQVIGRVFDSSGQTIGEQVALADVGGNWMLQFHQLRSLDHARFEFVEVAGNWQTFDTRGDIFGYLGADRVNNDYASLEPWTPYSQAYEFTANYRPSVQQSLIEQHRIHTRPLGLGR